jgi:signal transduction histidine kinase
MRRLLFGSTARQVAWVVGLATLSSNLLVLGVWVMLSPGSIMPGSVRAFAAEVVTIFEMIERADPAERPALIAAVGPEMLRVQPVGEFTQGGRFDNILTRALLERAAERGVNANVRAVSPSGDPRRDLVVMIGSPAAGNWRFDLPEARTRLVVPNLALPPTTLLLLLGVPLLLVLLWMASRVTRPLEQLARLAGSLGTAGHGTVLPEVGTSEIRQLTRAINGLLVRLREDVAERARILAGVSHDLRTPMTRLRLRLETVPGEEVRARLGADLAQMERIVGASLALLESDLREEEAEPLDLAALAGTVRDQFADAGHHVTYEGRCTSCCAPSPARWSAR